MGRATARVAPTKSGVGADDPVRPMRCKEESPSHGFAVPAPFRQGGLGDGDADCHSQCAHWLRNDIVFCKECGTKPGGSSGRPTPTHRLSIELRRGRRPRRPVCTSPHICVGRRALTPPFSRKKTRGKPRFPPARTQNYLSAATDLTTLTSRPL